MTTSRVVSALAAIALVSLLAFLLFKAQSVDSTYHDRYNADLLTLKESDAALNEAVLRTRYGLLVSYDPLNAELAQIRRLQSAVKAPPSYLSQPGQADIQRGVEAFGKELDHKDGLIQQFKSSNAVINNSLRYFPIASRNLAGRLVSDPRAGMLTADLHLLVADVLGYSLAPDQQLEIRIRALIDRLSRTVAGQDPATGAELLIVINHADTILTRKPALDSLTKELISIPTAQHAERLYHAYTQHYDVALESSQFYRLCLYVFSVALLCLIILQLRNATRGLRAATQGLELEVRQRTQANQALQAEVNERQRAEQYIDKLLRQNALLLNSVSEGIVGVDLDGNGMFINPAAATMVGWDVNDLIGQPHHDALHHSRQDGTPYPREECPICAASRDGIRDHGTDEVFWRKDGTSFPVEYTSTPIREHGALIGSVVTFRDISERIRIEAELRKRETQLIEAQGIARIGNFHFDVASGQVAWSDNLWEIYGLAPREHGLSRAEYFESVHPDDRALVQNQVEEALRENRFTPLHHRIVRPDGTVRVIASDGKLIFGEHGLPIAVAGIIQDVTQQKEMEEQLKHARDAALESARFKSEFLANTSHEIRTPMNGVIGMTEVLLQTNLDADQRDYAETIRSSAESLLTIINDVLDFSKIEAGLLRFEKMDFDLRDAVEASVYHLAERAQAKGLELASLVHHDVPVALLGDQGRLQQVLTNLAGNAVKFTDSGEVVVVVTKTGETASHAKLRFEIRDTGIGIGPEAQGGLFRPFTQADGSTTRKYGGTGLGLAISKQIVELMSGEIGIESTPGAGSTFWFTAEFQKQIGLATTVSETAGSLSAARVLIVDDNAMSRSILTYHTGSWGMVADQAESGERALELLRAAASDGNRYDLAILDAMMPRMNGLELAVAIQADPTIAAVALVLLSSGGRRVRDDGGRQAGIAAYQQKPVRQSQLHACLTAVLAGNAGVEPIAQTGYVTRQSTHGVESRREDKAFSNVRIIIAEDNLVNQKVALKQLYNLGYRAAAVPNGRELLEALEHAEFDLILMDCQMPEMDGFAATVEIRRRERGARRITIIAMTANALEGDEMRCFAAGMDDYLSKPVSAEVLRRKLERWTTSAETTTFGAASGRAGVPAGHARSSVIDLSRLADMRAGQEPGEADFVTELIDLFVKQTVSQLNLLQGAVSSNDATEMRRLAHLLKGGSAEIGARQMASLLEQLEGKAGVEGDAGALLESVDSEFGLVREALEAERR